MTQLTEADVETRVRSTLGRVFHLQPEATRGDLHIGNPPQWDSLGHMQLLVEIENEFGIRFQTHEIAGLATIEKIAAAVRDHEGAR